MARILILDDDEAVRTAEQQVLTLRGHDVQIVSTLAEALALLQPQPVDLILTDTIAPTLWQLTPGPWQALQQATPGTPLVLQTGFPAAAAVDPAAWGLAGILVKPFGAPQLLAIVRAVLG